MKKDAVSPPLSSTWKEEAGLLRDCDRRADEHFRMLDAMEEKCG
jgi:hypothetical protein